MIDAAEVSRTVVVGVVDSATLGIQINELRPLRPFLLLAPANHWPVLTRELTLFVVLRLARIRDRFNSLPNSRKNRNNAKMKIRKPNQTKPKLHKR